MSGEFFIHAVEDLTCARCVAHAQQTSHHASHGGDFFRRVFEDLTINICRALEILFLESLVRLLHGLFHRRRADWPGQPLDKTLHLAFRLLADKAIYRLAVLERKYRRNRLNAHLHGDFLVLVDVDLDQFDLALGRIDDLFQGRAESFAGFAPGCPEIADDGLHHRRFDDIGGESLGGAFHARAWCASILSD